jgi:hypothetical protein
LLTYVFLINCFVFVVCNLAFTPLPQKKERKKNVSHCFAHDELFSCYNENATTNQIHVSLFCTACNFFKFFNYLLIYWNGFHDFFALIPLSTIQSKFTVCLFARRVVVNKKIRTKQTQLFLPFARLTTERQQANCHDPVL